MASCMVSQNMWAEVKQSIQLRHLKSSPVHTTKSASESHWARDRAVVAPAAAAPAAPDVYKSLSRVELLSMLYCRSRELARQKEKRDNHMKRFRKLNYW